MTASPPAHWLLPADPAYPPARRRLSASSWLPKCYPAAISRPRTARQVCADVRTAAERGLGIAVRSGGHSTNGTYLAEGALTVDLGGFRDVAVDAENATAWIGPGLIALDAARALEGAGGFFPLGHAPTVGLGGFLLAGGNGWNTPVWGHGCDRVLAAEVVLTDGRLRRIDAGNEPELFALLRGAGPAFPAVVTAFQIALVRDQPQIRRLVLTVDGSRPGELGRVLDEVIDQLPAHVETTVFWHPGRGPDEQPNATVAATSFSPDSDADGLAALREADLPVLDTAEAAPGPSLLRLLDPLPRHRGEAIFSDHTWTEARYADVLPLLPEREDRLLPSASVLLTTAVRRAGLDTRVAVDDGGSTEAAQASSASEPTEPADSTEAAASPAALYRPGGRMSISAYAHWDPAALPPEIAITWARQVIARLQPYSTGRYVGEADLTSSATAADCFGPAGAARLTAARARFDPDGLLHTPFPS